MKQIVLHDEVRDARERTLYQEFARAKWQKGRVFRTAVIIPAGGKPNYFLTTSKDIHLRLGEVSEDAKWDLFRLIEDNLHSAQGGILIAFEDGEGGWAIFATMEIGKEHENVVHLAPAR